MQKIFLNKNLFYKYIILGLFIIVFIGLTIIPEIGVNDAKIVTNEFSAFDTTCVKVDIINVDGGKLKINKMPRDIYLSESLQNIKCIGRVVQLVEDSNSLTLFYGRNLKLNYLLNISIFLTLLAGLILKSKTNIVFIVMFQQFIFFVANFHLFTFYKYLIQVASILIFYYLLLLIFDDQLQDNVRKFGRFTDNIDTSYLNKLSINKKMSSPVEIVILSFYGSFIGLSKYLSKGNFDYFNDELIQIFTAAKMHYLNFSSINSTLKHHTPINSELFQLIFKVSDFNNFHLGIVVLETTFAIITTLLFYFVLKKLGNNTFINFIFSFVYITFLSTELLLNRVIAQLIYVILIFLIINYSEIRANYTLFSISFFAMLQIYNMESYVPALFLIFIYLIKNLFTNNREILKTIFYSLCSLLIIYFRFFLDGNLNNLYKSNYYFHLFNTINNFDLSNLFTSIGQSNDFSFKHIIFLFIIVRIILISKTQTESSSVLKFEKLFLYWFVGEFIHLILTGPRFTHYGLVLILPTVFLCYIYCDLLIEKKKITLTFIFVLLFSASFIGNFMQISLNILERRPTTLEKIVNTEDEQIIYAIINNNSITPTPMLTWIHPVDWNFAFTSLNKLPASKYWFWFFMKYYQTDKYTWENNWDEKEIVSDFYEDINKEKPNFALVDKYMVTYPTFFQHLLDKDYELIFDGEEYQLYEYKY
jgi:hypothetical protein